MSRSGCVIAFNIIFLIFLTGCIYGQGIRYDETYKGKIIDADTGEPIAEVVVLGVWNREYPTAAGAIHKFHGARETITDENGEFKILGMGLLIQSPILPGFSNIEPMDVLIFKAGYEHIGYISWESFKEDILLRKRIKWEGDKAIIPLRKLTMEERRRQGTPDFYIGERYDEKENTTHSCLPKNIKLLPKEVNKELLEQGLKPYDLEGGWCEK